MSRSGQKLEGEVQAPLTYLARRIEKTDDAEAREALLRLIAAHSPMAWAHINMLGEYDFSDEKLRDSVGILPLKSAA